MRGLAFLMIPIAAMAAAGARAQVPEPASALETRVWLDRGDEPLLERGQQVRVFYRTTEDAFAAIFRIDTDGVVSLVFPQRPAADHAVLGGRDYRLVFPRSPLWRVDEDPGAGYFFMLASPEPLDFSAFSYDPEWGWDLSGVGEFVYEDPYVAIDNYVAALIPDWELVPYALDFLTYNVENTYAYPRFLCYDCHERRSYASWNPYDVPCTSYRVVIWDDPYFYPRYRYSGTRVVVARPLRALPRYEVASRAPGDGWRPLVRAREAPLRNVAQYKESDAPVPTSPVTPLRRRVTTPSGRQQAPQAAPAPQERPGATPDRPTLQRRPSTPSARLPVRSPPPRTTRPAPEPPNRGASPPSRTTPEPRIVRPRSAPTRPEPTPARPQASPTRPPTRAAPTRPSNSAGQRPPATSRPAAPSRPPRAGGSTARPAAPSRPSERPSTGSRPTTGARPSARPSEPRPTVRARPAPQRRPAN